MPVFFACQAVDLVLCGKTMKHTACTLRRTNNVQHTSLTLQRWPSAAVGAAPFTEEAMQAQPGLGRPCSINPVYSSREARQRDCGCSCGCGLGAVHGR